MFCPYNGNQCTSIFYLRVRQAFGWTISIANIKHSYCMVQTCLDKQLWNGRFKACKHWFWLLGVDLMWEYCSSTAPLGNIPEGIQTLTFQSFTSSSAEFQLFHFFFFLIVITRFRPSWTWHMTKEQGNHRLQSTLGTPTAVTILKNHQESSHLSVFNMASSAHVWESSHKVCSINQSLIQQGTVQSYFRTGLIWPV